MTAGLGRCAAASAMCERPLTERARLRLPWQVARSATGARTNLHGDSIACNAMAHARRAQRPRRFPRDAPDVRSRAEAAGLTATGTTQRTPTEADGARRATGTTQARRESLTGGTSASMGCGAWEPGLTYQVTGAHEASEAPPKRVRVHRRVRLQQTMHTQRRQQPMRQVPGKGTLSESYGRGIEREPQLR